MKNKFLLWALIALSVLTLSQSFGADKKLDSQLEQNEVGVMTSKKEYRVGKEIVVTIQNNTLETVSIDADCPDEPLSVEYYKNGNWIQKNAHDEKSCEKNLGIEITPGKSTKVSYKDWSYRLFSETGRYRIKVLMNDQNGTPQEYISNEFEILEAGWLSIGWMELIYKPILNTLIFLIEILPGHSLGLGIILLTLIIRTLLLIPSQRALRSQKKMQEIQGKIEELKKKHEKNPEKLALETFNLWKTHKVNPFGSCLMILIQFPILIALYYVVQQGLSPDKTSLLYPWIGSDLQLSEIHTNFLGILELTEINFIVLPLIVGGLQYFQIQLTMMRNKKKQETKKNEKSLTQKIEGTKDLQSEMQMANTMMKYIMPVMIAFFTASLPAGVGLYWATSTIYGIVQQIVVNKESADGTEKNEPTVRVVK